MADLKFRSYKDLPVATTVTDKDKVVGINLSTNKMELLSANGLGGEAIHIYSYYPSIQQYGTVQLQEVWTSFDEFQADTGAGSSTYAIEYDDFIAQCVSNGVNFISTPIYLHLCTQYVPDGGVN